MTRLELLKKCNGATRDGRLCADKWTCVRYYVRPGVGDLEPNLTDRGCLDHVPFRAAERRDGR
jgi:hypothetical protein